MFRVLIRLANLFDREKSVDLFLPVSNTSTLSIVPTEELIRLGLTPDTVLPFCRPGGEHVDRSVGTALLTVHGVTMPVPLVFGEEGDFSVLGSTSLELLGFAFDSVEGRLFRCPLRRFAIVGHSDPQAPKRDSRMTA